MLRNSPTYAGILAGLLTTSLLHAQIGQAPQLPGSAIPQFVDPLPSLHIVAPGAAQLTVNMEEFRSPVLPSTFVPAAGTYTGTWVWGYKVPGQPTALNSYIGPVIVAQRNVPTEIKWVNNLGTTATSQLTFWKVSVDQTMHWADPLNDEANAASHWAAHNPGQLPLAPWDQTYAGPIPAVVHVHGGELPPQLDGGPDAWFLSDGSHKGHAYYTKTAVPGNQAIYRYPNSQEAAPIWFHDHTLGATRLNVYAGLAGAYLITDPANDPANLPGPIVPLVIQDRSFDVNGQLFFPNIGDNPDHLYWLPEFVGDVIVVNGKAWPFFNVEPKRYRFLFLNGSNARAYQMHLVDQVSDTMGPAMYQIGTDGGYLDAPVKIDPNAAQLTDLVLMPGERADVIIDFTGIAPGTQLLLRNTARTPFPGGATPIGKTTGRIMVFNVVAGNGAPDTSFDPAAAGATLRAPMVRLVNPATGTPAAGITPVVKRQLTLNEVMAPPSPLLHPATGLPFPGGPVEVLVNNTRWDGRRLANGGFVPIPGSTKPDPTVETYYTEVPKEGATELWEIINMTADAHPIHLHLVQFQLMNRQRFDTRRYDAMYQAAFPGGAGFVPAYGPPLLYTTANADGAVGGNPPISRFLRGPAQPPAPNEAGWKDTVIMYPGEVTRIMVRWAPTDLPAGTTGLAASFPFDPNHGHGYVWHCHIIDHEDNEMMRPVSIISNLVPRNYVMGVDY